MEKNLKKFLTKAIILVAVIYFTRVLFQFPVEYFNLALFKQTIASRLFSKIDGLKVLSIVVIFFAFYYRKKVAEIDYGRFNLKSSLIFLLLGELAVASYYLVRFLANYYEITQGTILYITQLIIFFILVSAFSLFVISVFSLSYLKKFVKFFKKELIITLIISIILYNLLIFFQNQWYVISKGVADILFFILSLFYDVLYYFNGNAPVLEINNFAVSIGAPCSGIDSMFLFISFFAAIYALDHKRLKKSIFFTVFIVGFIGVYIVNVLRLLLLILVGIHISPRFAVGLFHTNAGWVFFLAYFLIYYLVIKKFIYQSNLPNKK